VIAGTHDESMPIEVAQALTRGIARAELATLQGCAHLSAVEQPEAFTELLGEFVASV